MADFTTNEKISIFLKMIFGIQGTSNTDDALGLQWYNEKYSWEPFVTNDKLIMESIPVAANSTEADVNVGANPTFLEKRDIKLSLVVGTNGRAWMAYKTFNDQDSGIYDDWLLPQLFGQGYALRLFQDNGSGTGPGTEITTTEGAWIPAYKLGAILLGDGNTAPEMGWTSPLWVRAYRYIGEKGVSGATAHVSLDDAYNESHVINVDDGPIVLNPSNDFAPLELTPVTTPPTEGLSGGQLSVFEDTLYLYDASRSKWLSAFQPSTSYQARQGGGNYLSTGVHSDVNSGYTTLKKGTIIGITASGGSGNQSKSFSVRKNGSNTDLTSFSLSSGAFNDDTIDIDFDEGDVLQVVCSANGAPIKAPRVNLIVAWRM